MSNLTLHFSACAIILMMLCANEIFSDHQTLLLSFAMIPFVAPSSAATQGVAERGDETDMCRLSRVDARNCKLAIYFVKSTHQSQIITVMHPLNGCFPCILRGRKAFTRVRSIKVSGLEEF